MTPREKELLEAARTALDYLAFWQPNLRYTSALRRAIAAYTDNPQAEHEACLARRVAEDGPPPVTDAPGFDGRDGGRMNINSIGADDR